METIQYLEFKELQKDALRGLNIDGLMELKDKVNKGDQYAEMANEPRKILNKLFSEAVMECIYN